MLALLSRLPFLLLLALFFVANIATAQPGDPGGDPDVPIDGGIGFLIAAGALYGVKRVYDMNRNKEINRNR